MINLLHLLRSRLTVFSVILALIAGIWLTSRSNRKLRADKSRLSHALVVSGDSLKHYRNSHGNLVSKIGVIELEKKELRRLYEAGQYEWIRQFESVNKRLKNLEMAQSVGVKVTERISSGMVAIDSLRVESGLDTIRIQAYKLQYATDFTTLRGIVTIDSSAHFSGDLEVKVPLQQVITTYREGWKLFGKRRSWLPFGRRRYETEVMSLNPNAKIDHIETIYLNGKKD